MWVGHSPRNDLEAAVVTHGIICAADPRHSTPGFPGIGSIAGEFVGLVGKQPAISGACEVLASP